jgi:hypothetical protein
VTGKAEDTRDDDLYLIDPRTSFWSAESRSPNAAQRHRDWTTDIADAAPYMAIVARHIAPKAPPKAELPPGIAMDALTMSEFMDLEDSWSTAAGSSLVSSR